MRTTLLDLNDYSENDEYNNFRRIAFGKLYFMLMAKNIYNIISQHNKNESGMKFNGFVISPDGMEQNFL